VSEQDSIRGVRFGQEAVTRNGREERSGWQVWQDRRQQNPGSDASPIVARGFNLRREAKGKEIRVERGWSPDS